MAAETPIPEILFVEFTSHCNLHCAFCPSDVLERPREHIRADDLLRFLEPIHRSPARPPILCNVLGEPLLNRDLYRFLELFERQGHEVTLITNSIPLRDPSVRRELLKHANLTIALSTQTVTPRGFEMRGRCSVSFDDFMKIPFALIEDKFRTGSRSRIEIHLAVTHSLRRDPTVMADADLRLWANFSDDRAELEWIRVYLEELDGFAKRIREFYPEAHAEADAAARLQYREQIGTKLSVNRDALPENFRLLPPELYWGYMFLPKVMLRFKLLELWNRHPRFLAAVFPGKFLYLEEHAAPRSCPMTRNLGILANGDLTLCCLDYEGEMGLGNIRSTDAAKLMGSERIARIRENAMLVPACRRCKGNLFVMDTEPGDRPDQPVNHFGAGWYPHEPEMHGVGGRWSSSLANAYVYCRIPARSVRLRFLSNHPDGQPFTLEIQAYDAAARTFSGSTARSFGGAPGGIREARLPFDFVPGSFYRLVLRSPTFIPAQRDGGNDTRALGLAVFDLELTV